MLDQIKIEDILFLDIETVPVTYKYDDLNDSTRKLWDTKFRFQTSDTPENLYKKAGIYAEFAKIVCISVGFMSGKSFRLKSFYGNDEKNLLVEFSSLLNKHYNKKESLLCAHNGKEFDYPFIARRILINGLKIPALLNIAGKKPWEVNLLDTMELWKFGDYKNFTSLNLLAAIFNIPTPKDDIDGSDVSRVYYEENNLDRIASYCQKDVLTVAQVFLKFKGEQLIEESQVVIT